jgi:hypothetical protein
MTPSAFVTIITLANASLLRNCVASSVTSSLSRVSITMTVGSSDEVSCRLRRQLLRAAGAFHPILSRKRYARVPRRNCRRRLPGAREYGRQTVIARCFAGELESACAQPPALFAKAAAASSNPNPLRAALLRNLIPRASRRGRPASGSTRATSSLCCEDVL